MVKGLGYAAIPGLAQKPRRPRLQPCRQIRRDLRFGKRALIRNQLLNAIVGTTGRALHLAPRNGQQVFLHQFGDYNAERHLGNTGSGKRV